MKRIGQTYILLFLLLQGQLIAQDKGLVNTSQSKFARLNGVGLSDVQWTKGFWAERFAICRDSMVPHLWNTYTDEQVSHSFKNFEIAAGLDTGRFKGPSFHDGDFYKTMEALAGMYALTHDPALDAKMDQAIAVIAKAQKADGYIYTKSIIEQQRTGKQKMFDDKLSFEAYNFGHLITAACVHYRATGKTGFLHIAQKAADFLIGFYRTATAEQARNAICPSHYMGLAELYRTTNEEKYLSLVTKLINIRGTTEGTDDNSDRMPFRDMKKVVGHAVRANYLFAGVADVYAETGDTSLLAALDKVWDNVVNHKLYVNGGCGALYDGVSVDGISYSPDTVQKIHQAYGRDYQLPNKTAHSETCANIGNVLWNWRMLQLTGNAKYADILELSLYNSVLSGVSLDGNNFFYTNPLAASVSYPYHLRWEGGRQPYIALSNCCPPNTVRTLAEVNNYMYGVSREGLYCHLYGGNRLRTRLYNGEEIQVDQQTAYPWDGTVTLKIEKAPITAFTFFLRIPGWSKGAGISINGKVVAVANKAGTYAALKRSWKTGDVIKLVLPMSVTLIESNPMVEETRNQVTVKRGPVVYCLESTDLPPTVKSVFDVVVPASTQWKLQPLQIDKGKVMALTGELKQVNQSAWNNSLYRELDNKSTAVQVRLIPYYAWANRGKTDMTVWMPLAR